MRGGDTTGWWKKSAGRTSAVGFGLDGTVAVVLESIGKQIPMPCDTTCIWRAGEDAAQYGVSVAFKLRKAGVSVEIDHCWQSVKRSQVCR